MPGTLTPAQRHRLIHMLSRLGGGSATERIALAREIQQLLDRANLTWDDLIVSPTSAVPSWAERFWKTAPQGGTRPDAVLHWRDAAGCCAVALRVQGAEEVLTNADMTFLRAIITYDTQPTGKQLRWLDDIISKLDERNFPWGVAREHAVPFRPEQPPRRRSPAGA